ncbi:MAG: GIY-YIG nuclease family protein [Clostridia bacterium]|nr:GIY-YIG nuclease family protein [Clostridia bacterium]
MKQEAEERKRLEQERKKVEAEEAKYKQEIERITEQMQKAHDSELEKLRKRLEEMNSMINKVEEKKAEIINLQNGKAGTVYIISNIGSFGDQVFKVGMTRRLEPQDRVNELGDASVPFPFDVHSFIFSEDAVALETALHHELNNRRVNKVNLRKEFFNVSIDELQAIVERIDPTAPFKVTALAEQYRQSLSIVEIPDQIPVSIEEE